MHGGTCMASARCSTPGVVVDLRPFGLPACIKRVTHRAPLQR